MLYMYNKFVKMQLPIQLLPIIGLIIPHRIWATVLLSHEMLSNVELWMCITLWWDGTYGNI